MQDSGIPTKITIPWANSAGGSYVRAIPNTSQIGITNGAASFPDGFPPNCFVPIFSGGSWPFGQDTNGILRQITQWLRWSQAGGPIAYDATFQSAVGGYPSGAIVASVAYPGTVWLSTADNNTTNPDTGETGWVAQSGVPVQVAAGTANALTTSFVPTIGATVGPTVAVKVGTTNTGAATFNGVSIVNPDGTALTAGQLVAGGIATLVGAGTAWCLVSIGGALPASIAGLFAALAGSATQNFSVADATTAHHAVALDQFGASFGTNGYQKLPGGLILQWADGTQIDPANNTDPTQTVLLPYTFPNAICSAIATTNLTTSSNYADFAYQVIPGKTVNSVPVVRQALGGGQYSGSTTWPTVWAIGH